MGLNNKRDRQLLILAIIMVIVAFLAIAYSVRSANERNTQIITNSK